MSSYRHLKYLKINQTVILSCGGLSVLTLGEILIMLQMLFSIYFMPDAVLYSENQICLPCKGIYSLLREIGIKRVSM